MIATTETETDQLTQVNFRLPVDLARRLRLRAADERRYPSHLVTDVLRAWLDREERPKGRKSRKASA